MKNKQTYNRENQGFIILMVAVVMTTVLAVAACVLDIGNAFYQRRKIQIAADFASLAAVRKVPSTTDVVAEANAVANANGLETGEIEAINCGTWDGSAFSAATCETTGVNAVRLTARREQSTYFAQILGVDTLFPHASAIALRGPGTPANCIRPFGIALFVLEPLSTGDTFTVGGTSAGNWGKLDIGGMMSSGKNFENAMVNNVCHGSVELGQSISQGTGFGGSISKIFEEIDGTPQALDMIIAVAPGFDSGNSNVTLLEFIKVDFVSQSGSGGTWEGTFILKERNAAPPTGSTAGGGVALLVE